MHVILLYNEFLSSVHRSSEACGHACGNLRIASTNTQTQRIAQIHLPRRHGAETVVDGLRTVAAILVVEQGTHDVDQPKSFLHGSPNVRITSKQIDALCHCTGSKAEQVLGSKSGRTEKGCTRCSVALKQLAQHATRRMGNKDRNAKKTGMMVKTLSKTSSFSWRVDAFTAPTAPSAANDPLEAT